MKNYFIKYKLFVGENNVQWGGETSIEATSQNVAVRKLERKLKKEVGIAFRWVEIVDMEVIGYF